MVNVQAAQLIARGEQDAWLSGDPQVSFYRSNFKRHTPFGMTTELYLVPMDGKIIVSPKSDLLGYTYLTAHDTTTGALVPNANWSGIIKSVELSIGNQAIATHDLTYINTIQKVFEADTYSKRSATPAFQPLGFFFDKNPLPIAALKYANVRINITWVSTSASTQYFYKCWASGIHIGEDERRFFETQRHQILIPRVQRVPISPEPYFSGPIKYIAAPCKNYVGAYDPILLNITSSDGVIPRQLTTSDTSKYFMCWARGVDLNVYNADGTLFGTFPKTNAVDDSFVIKSNKATGQVEWVVRIRGASYDDADVMCIDTSENVYIAGATNSNPIIFYSTNGTSVSLNSASGFIVKYDSNGIVQWATRTVDGNIRTMSIEGSNVYVAGYFTSTTITAYDAPGTTSSIPSINKVTSSDGYIVKYNSSGQAQWMTIISGVALQSDVHTLSVDSTGIYYSGTYTGPTVTIYDAPGTPSSLSSISVPSGKQTNILVKYSFSGQAIWFSKAVGDIDSTLRYNISYKNSIFRNVGILANGTVSLYDSQNNLNSTLTNTDTVRCTGLVRYDQFGNIVWSTKYSRGLGLSIYNDTILAQSYGVKSSSFYNIDGTVVNVYGDEISGNIVVIGRYSLDGTIISTRKITGILIPNTLNLFTEGYIYINKVTNGFYRVYDTGSDSRYQTIQIGNLASVYVKFMGGFI